MSMNLGNNRCFEPDTIQELLSHGFDDVIDVRSPTEFGFDHIEGAINLPVMDDRQRELVGTVYSQDSQFRARRIGAAIIARSMADRLENELADRSESYKPLVYCWRGGKRSGAFVEICRQVGWQAMTLSGGYRHYRRLVGKLLYDKPFPFTVIKIAGPTGTAKTEIINQLGRYCIQSIDLEWCASHKGSIFGGAGDGQPTQKRFESRLVGCMQGFRQDQPVVVEAESRRIGKNAIPPAMWDAMQRAGRVNIVADMKSRADYIVNNYRWLTEDSAHLTILIDRLRKYHSNELVSSWQSLAGEGNHCGLVMHLMQRHYDPLYERSADSSNDAVLGTVELSRLSQNDIREGALKVADTIRNNS